MLRCAIGAARAARRRRPAKWGAALVCAEHPVHPVNCCAAAKPGGHPVPKHGTAPLTPRMRSRARRA